MPKNKDKDKFQLGKLGYHEALDRLHLILCNIDDFLLDHKAIQKHKEILAKVETASALLADCYQEIGAIEFNKFNN